MQELLTNLLGNTQGFLAYAAVFGILVACGLGVPLPEDISLILGGFLAHKGAASLPVMMAVGFGGILVGDSLIFYAGRRLGTNVGKNQKGGFFARLITPEKRAKVEGLFGIHGQKIVMIARFMPGVRAVTYFTAGSVGMPYWRFIFWDGLAALLSAPVFVWLGFHFGSELDFLIGKFKEGQYVVMAALAVGGVGFFLWRRRKAKAALNAAAAQSVAQPPVVRVPVEGPVASAPRAAPFMDAAEKQTASLSRAPELQK
ncbi:membrane protein DedA, SNARE-associated domain [Stigmatella aurantiaca]|uniref:Membrane protein DedA, SNARE-associated domain n=1 Tax=Stigmatella aurantiaca TaxID=41 RepID=A0A1H7JRH2_STIAU|nr:DedA family protein [Stigmatella aurantiaca]SEK77122.1 membrane protein DedA, SNARE-associated domain [Stigmatella aurantiaca]